MSVSAIQYPVSVAILAPSESCPADASLPKKRRIVLCVDDDSVVLYLQRHLLEAAGFAVVTAGDPKDALRACVSARPDVVVLDYAIPGTTGSALAAQMRKLRTDVLLILCSGSGEISEKDAKPFDRVLLKGTAAGSLIPVLREWFQSEDTRSPRGDTADNPVPEGMTLPPRSQFPL